MECQAALGWTTVLDGNIQAHDRLQGASDAGENKEPVQEVYKPRQEVDTENDAGGAVIGRLARKLGSKPEEEHRGEDTLHNETYCPTLTNSSAPCPARRFHLEGYRGPAAGQGAEIWKNCWGGGVEICVAGGTSGCHRCQHCCATGGTKSGAALDDGLPA